ncbi:MAG: serine--tRNA ligase [Alphaproteobacteria bacterium]|nr:serine--tRNA ligase [Alphaproteobacteria bacterium]
MHDIRLVRDDPDGFAAGLSRRGLDGAAIAAGLATRDKALRELLTRLQTQQARRNEASKLIGQAKAKKDEAQAKALLEEVAGLKDAIQQGEAEQRTLEAGLRDALATIPNIPAADVPDGPDESANVPVPGRAFGPPPEIANPRQHFEIGEALEQMDFERAAKVSGARFVYLKSDLARLERAIAAFMLDMHTQRFGYTEVSPPVLVHSTAMFGTGQLPKFQDDLFRVPVGEGDPFWLVPTAEVPLTNYVADEIVHEAELPLRMTAFTPCFRAEAGAAGRDTRGMIRMHQFSKVELVSITTPEQSAAEHERMTDAAQEILKTLDLAHRVVTLCTGDMGFSAQKTYDIEVWLPGQNAYREISSCSNCGPFQALRMNTRWRGADGKVKGPVHTLNGSGLAVGRTLVAVLENYQQPDGSVAIPPALQPYMGGKTTIAKP